MPGSGRPPGASPSCRRCRHPRRNGRNRPRCTGCTSPRRARSPLRRRGT
eukprot:XP_001710292.1 Hypothetical protein GL50803_38044 [Giardia lamblia ATCC 50803]